MGKATRWLRGLLLGGKKQVPAGDSKPTPAKEKKRWGFARSFRDKEQQGKGEEVALGRKGGASYKEGTTRPSCASSAAFSVATAAAVVDVDDQNKRAIAVAAATAAVAEAAVAAAQAAAAVVRLTSCGRAYAAAGIKGGDLAAIKIQAAFRGYLARRALRALRGLVKLQALVRGHIVRKQAAETLRCMHALVRVQARALACRALSENRHPNRGSRHGHPGPSTPEKCESTTRANSAKHHDKDGTLKRNGSKPINVVGTNDSERTHSSGWNWLDRWMEGRYSDGQEVSSRAGAATDDDKNDKILEIDTGKPHLNCTHRTKLLSMTMDQHSHSFATTMPDSPSKDSTTAQHSLPSPSSVDMQQSLIPLRFPLGDPCESPQFFSPSSRPGSASRGPFTPSKSECAQSFLSSFSDYPNYMSNTESSRAKARSQSAPKQRPEYEKSGSIKRLSVQGSTAGMQQHQQLSTSSSQRSSSLHLKFSHKAYPGSGRLDRLGMPVGY